MTGPRHFHLAAETRAILDANARRQHAALHVARRTQAHAVASLQIALHVAVDYDFRRYDIRIHAAARAHRHAPVGQMNFSVRLTFRGRCSPSLPILARSPALG